MAKYEVRRRRWPFRKPLKRPWELIRVSDMKPVGFYETKEEAESMKIEVEKAEQMAGDFEASFAEVQKILGQ